MMKTRRVIIIGLDGVPFGLIRDLSSAGVMPNTNAIISHSTFRPMRSSIPEVSSVAWSSIITGKNPAEHGIFGFTALNPQSYDLRFPNFNDLKATPFWDILDGTSIIINVPSTYPVRPMKGVLISGFVSIDIRKSVFPPSLLPTLQALDYRLDVDSEKGHKSLDLFLEDLDATLKARINAYKYLWNYADWQVFMLVFTGTDRLMHFLWDAYEDENHQYHSDFLDHFRKIDGVIGEIYAQLHDGDLFMMFSDHGFEKLNSEVYINYLLHREGFLKFRNPAQTTWQNIDDSTKAFALDPARIYLHFKHRYARGSVALSDKESILKDLDALFTSLEIDGKKVIKRVYRKDEIYSGPLMDTAPDLVLVSEQGFDLKARLNLEQLYGKRIFTGKHTLEDAFLLLRDTTTSLPQNLSVFDIKEIIFQFLKA
ncbi:alkaline phosphatase family protein [Candidatus Sumerlaeota bacterium]|nr:alkaline phosphatase family protein [Candidatus Sumerlaeota bacterium]